MKALVTYKVNSWIQEIANNLEEEFGEEFHFIKARNGEMGLINGNNSDILDHYDSLIRFGTYANYLPSADKVYNSYESIKLTSNKLKARQKFEEELVPTPETHSRREIREILRREREHELVFPIIAREGNHYGGNNFFVYDNPEELKEGLFVNDDLVYFSEFYPKSREFRVHIASGKAIIVAEKIVAEENQHEYVWNLGDNGACDEFNTLRWSEYHNIEHIIATASLATKVIGLDYGAVDVIANPTSRQDELPPVAVLEINSAPRLEEYGISRYTQYFKWLLKHKNERAEFKLPHELDRFSFTNSDFDNEYVRLENETDNQENEFESRELEEEEFFERPTRQVRDLETEVEEESRRTEELELDRESLQRLFSDLLEM